VEAAKSAGISSDFTKIGVKVRDPVLMRFFFRQQMSTTAMFGGMFAVYQTVQCACRRNEMDLVTSTAVAGPVALVPFISSRLFRRNLPWALVLIGLDIYGGGMGKRHQ